MVKILFRHRYLFILVLAIFLLGYLVLTAPERREKIRQKSINVLTESSNWIITHGIGDFYKTKNLSGISKHIYERNVSFVYEGVFKDEKYFLAKTAIRYAPYGAEITCWQRINYNNMIYEYWTIAYGSKQAIPFIMRFVIARADTLTDERQILRDAKVFFKEFKIDDKMTIRYPLENPRFVYVLEPWRFPNAFKGTELEGVTENDIRKKLGWPLLKKPRP